MTMAARASEFSQWWRGRPVLVTGAAGLLGSHLCRALTERGAHVVGVMRDHVASVERDEKVTWVAGDIRDQPFMERVLNGYEIKTVYHLAAQAIVGVANRNPIETFDSNIRGTWTVLEAARRVPGIEQILVASSDKAYGANEKLPYTESSPLHGLHPYDVSKSCTDLIAQTYAHTYGLPVGIVRCCNLFGGGDLHWNRLVPGTMRSALEGSAPIIRSDGSMTRDYLYVEDGVDAYLTFTKALHRDASLCGQAFNFGNNAPLTVLELVLKILDIAGRADLEPKILGEASNEIPAQYLDSTRAMEVLGWQPKFGLRAGLTATLAWYRKFLKSEPI